MKITISRLILIRRDIFFVPKGVEKPPEEAWEGNKWSNNKIGELEGSRKRETAYQENSINARMSVLTCLRVVGREM